MPKQIMIGIFFLLCTSHAPADNHFLPGGIEQLEAVNQRIVNIDTEELEQLIKEEPSLVIIDVRNEDEVNVRGGMIDGRRELIVPRGWLEFRIENEVADKNTPIVVYCGINQRSPLAADTLQNMGYTNVKNYADGFFSWKEKNNPVKFTDHALDSLLFRKPEKVTDRVWSAIGATAPGTYTNSGHNNNLSFVIGDDSVMVFNAGDNYLLAKAFHEEIRKITKLPISAVILENGQGHAMLGSSYWQDQGVPVMAHVDTANEIHEYGHEVIERMRRRNGEKARHTRLTLPDKTFVDKMIIDLGGIEVELLYLGPAHSPGDIVAWIPAENLVISGDMAFHQRLLPLFEHTDSAAWIDTWEKFAALNATIVVPGHGDPTDMAEVTRYTRDYLIDLRQMIAEVIDNDGDLQQAYEVDQSAYAHLDTFHELATLNADRVFRAMEFE
ncbi:MAG: rhodanese-like domain-containing protein [Pseudomonadota bacterium]